MSHDYPRPLADMPNPDAWLTTEPTVIHGRTHGEPLPVCQHDSEFCAPRLAKTLRCGLPVIGGCCSIHGRTT